MSSLAAPRDVAETGPPRPSSAAWSDDTVASRRVFKFHLLEDSRSSASPTTTSGGEQGYYCSGSGSVPHDGGNAYDRCIIKGRRPQLRIQLDGDTVLVTRHSMSTTFSGLRPKTLAGSVTRINVADIQDVSCSSLGSGCLSNRFAVRIAYGDHRTLRLLSNKRHRVETFMEDLQRLRCSLQGSVARPSPREEDLKESGFLQGVCVDVTVRERGQKGGLYPENAYTGEATIVEVSESLPHDDQYARLHAGEEASVGPASQSSGPAIPVLDAPLTSTQDSPVRRSSVAELSFQQPSLHSTFAGASTNDIGNGEDCMRPSSSEQGRGGAAQCVASAMHSEGEVDSHPPPPPERNSVFSKTISKRHETLNASKIGCSMGGVIGERRVALPMSDDCQLPGAAAALPSVSSPVRLDKERSEIVDLHALGWDDEAALRCSLPLMGTVPGEGGEGTALQLAGDCLNDRKGAPAVKGHRQPSSFAMAPNTPLRSAPMQTPPSVESVDFTLDQANAPSRVDTVGCACSPSGEFSCLSPIQVGQSPLLGRYEMLLLPRDLRQQPNSVQRYSSHRQELNTTEGDNASLMTDPSNDEGAATQDGSSLLRGLVSTNTEALLSPESVFALREMQMMGGTVEGVLHYLNGGELTGYDAEWGSSESDCAGDTSGSIASSGQLLTAQQAAVLYDL